MRVIKDETCTLLLIDGVRCVVQSYIVDDYVNLSPVLSGQELIKDKLDNIRIHFANERVSTEGKESAFWKTFTSNIDFKEVNRILRTRNDITKKYHGQIGVFTHDMYNCSDEEYAAGFLAAFKEYGEALKFANEKGKKTALHFI